MPTYEEGFAAGVNKQKSENDARTKAALMALDSRYSTSLKSHAFKVLKGETSAESLEMLIGALDVLAAEKALAEATLITKETEVKLEAPTSATVEASDKELTEEDFMAAAMATANRTVQ
jgi:hypothetical protein